MDKREQNVQMLIRFFNIQCGTSFKVSIKSNVAAMGQCIDAAIDE